MGTREQKIEDEILEAGKGFKCPHCNKVIELKDNDTYEDLEDLKYFIAKKIFKDLEVNEMNFNANQLWMIKNLKKKYMEQE